MANFADGGSVKGVKPSGSRPGDAKPVAGQRWNHFTDLHGPRGGFRERHSLESRPHEYPGQLARAHRTPHHQRGR